MNAATLADAIEDALPQTQCTRCGYPDCRSYAQAIAQGRAALNRCPPGGSEGVARLAALTGWPVLPLDPACGQEGPLRIAFIEEAACIGCTLCIKACPVDCIVGAPKRMHTVIESDCTGCELCVPACPVDCIHLEVATPDLTGWQAWSPAQAQRARVGYAGRQARRERRARLEQERLEAKAQRKLADLPGQTRPADADELARKRAVIEAALARARARRGEPVQG